MDSNRVGPSREKSQNGPQEPPVYYSVPPEKYQGAFGIQSNGELGDQSPDSVASSTPRVSKWAGLRRAMGIARKKEKPSKWIGIRSALGISGETLIPEIVASTSVFWVFFWILAYVGLTGVFIYQMSVLVTQYLEYDVDTTITLVRSTESTFPSVTVCNSNPLRKSLISKLTKYEVLAELDSSVTGSMFNSLGQDFDINYSSIVCEDYQTQCVNSMQCIPSRWICNGRKDCDNNWDEGADVNGSPLDCDLHDNGIPTEYNQWNPDGYCNEGLVRCNDTIPLCAVPCNNITECPDGFDEAADPLNCTQFALCGGDLAATSSDQTFTSDGYPSTMYKNDLDCVWQISTTTGGEIIELSIDSSFDIEADGSGTCPYDFLMFHDGNSQIDEVIRVDGRNKLCGSVAPTAPIRSTGVKMLVRFFSDYTARRMGFRITYKSAPPPTAARVKREAEEAVIKINRRGLDMNMAPAYTRNRRDIQSMLRVRRSDSGSSSDSSSSYSGSSGPSSSSNYYGSDGGLTYNSNFWSNYYSWYNNFDPYSAFDENMAEYDWRQAYDDSTALDYSDLRPFARFPLEELNYFGTQANDFIAQCTYDGRNCDPSQFKQYPNPKFGNCFIFNSIYDTNMQNGIYSEVRNTSKTGKENGLKLTLFLDKEEYIGVLSQSSAAQVLVNAPYVPPLPESESFTASAGTATLIAIKQEVIERKGGKYGDCLSEWPKFITLDQSFTVVWPRYDQKVCEHYCVQSETFRECGCITDYFDGVPLCSGWNATSRDCTVEVSKLYKNGNFTCPCNAACNDVLFSKEASTAEWPNVNYTPYLIEKLRKYTTSDRITEYLQKIVSDPSASVESLNTNIKKNFVRVEIYYQNLNFQKIQEKPSYSTTQLITDFGGNIGLWIGWSVLTFLEIFVFFINMMKVIIFGSV